MKDFNTKWDCATGQCLENCDAQKYLLADYIHKVGCTLQQCTSNQGNLTSVANCKFDSKFLENNLPFGKKFCRFLDDKEWAKTEKEAVYSCGIAFNCSSEKCLYCSD